MISSNQHFTLCSRRVAKLLGFAFLFNFIWIVDKLKLTASKLQCHLLPKAFFSHFVTLSKETILHKISAYNLNFPASRKKFNFLLVHWLHDFSDGISCIITRKTTNCKRDCILSITDYLIIDWTARKENGLMFAPGKRYKQTDKLWENENKQKHWAAFVPFYYFLQFSASLPHICILWIEIL